MTADRPQPHLPVPLDRRWSVRWSETAHPIPAAGVPPSPLAGRIFLAVGTEIRPIAPGTGEYAWSADLGSEPRWVGYQADRVLAATDSRLVALDLATGSQRWSLEAGSPARDALPRNPFAQPKPVAATPEALGPLTDFRIVGDRIFCRRGDRELIAIDGETGLPDWSYRPEAGSLSPRWAVDAQEVLLQRRSPNSIVRLDSSSGRLLREFAQTAESEAWARDPWPLDADHSVIVPDSRTVALLDLETGRPVWTYREPSALPRGAPPTIFGDEGRILVLRDGSELVRLDPATGQKLWSRLLGVDDLADAPGALLVDADRVVVATGPMPTVTAYDISDGQPAWRRFLGGPPGRWALALSDRCLLAHPSPEAPAPEGLHILPLVLCARDDGRILQRLQLTADVTDLTVSLTPGMALVATQSGGWALGEGQGIDAMPEPK